MVDDPRTPPVWVRFLLRPAIYLVVAASMGCCCINVRNPMTGRTLEESIVFVPSKHPIGNWAADEGLFEDAQFTAEDGTKLHGWFAAAPNAKHVILHCHGNAGNISHRRWVLDMYRNGAQASILVFDYRGYGKSEGTPNEKGVLQDARAARAWLAKRTGVAEKEIVVVGESLGGAIAVDLAAKDGARALILENTFTSIRDVASSKIPIMPVSSILRTNLDSAAIIKDYHGPLLQTHGKADRVIPFALGKALFDAANEPKQFVAIENGDHNDGPSREYMVALKKFLAGLSTP